MNIISHRGYWQDPKEKNTTVAFKRSFSLGYGTETDIRDFNSRLVISHDIANKKSIPLDDFFDIHQNINPKLPLALNIKADGLQSELGLYIKKYDIKNYYVFDMSIPDTLGYIKNEIIFFSRNSEYESTPSFLEQAKGIWLDSFIDMWFKRETLQNFILKGKLITIVSAELHKRDRFVFWEKLKPMASGLEKSITLCTDFPEEASLYFK